MRAALTVRRTFTALHAHACLALAMHALHAQMHKCSACAPACCACLPPASGPSAQPNLCWACMARSEPDRTTGVCWCHNRPLTSVVIRPCVHRSGPLHHADGPPGPHVGVCHHPQQPAAPRLQRHPGHWRGPHQPGAQAWGSRCKGASTGPLGCTLFPLGSCLWPGGEPVQGSLWATRSSSWWAPSVVAFPCSRLALPAFSKHLVLVLGLQVGLTMALVVLQNGW